MQDKTRPDFRNKRREIERHLLPFFDSTPLTAINRFQVDRLRVKLRATPAGRWKNNNLSPKSINNILGTLKTMLNLAFEYEFIGRVPKIKMEKVARRDPKFLTEPEFRASAVRGFSQHDTSLADFADAGPRESCGSTTTAAIHENPTSTKSSARDAALRKTTDC